MKGLLDKSFIEGLQELFKVEKTKGDYMGDVLKALNNLEIILNEAVHLYVPTEEIRRARFKKSIGGYKTVVSIRQGARKD
jgi:hypothetical protein